MATDHAISTSPLGHPTFRWLLAGSTVNMLGGSIAPVALAFAVIDLGGRATELGLVVGAYALAEVLSVLLGGVLGDRMPRVMLMSVSNAAAALTQVAVAASIIGGWGSIEMLMLIGILHGSVAALGGPASRAITPQTVPAAALPRAVALRRLGQNLAQILGFGVAGVLVVAVGPGWALAVDGATFVVAAACFSRIRVVPIDTGERTGMLTELRLGTREVLARTWLWVLILQALIYHLFYGGAQGVLGPLVVEDALGRSAWGWSLSAMMLGFAVGGLVTLRWRPRRLLAVGVGFLSLTALFPAAMAYADSLALLLAGAFLHGFGLEIFSVAWELAIQQNISPAKLSRVYSLDLVGSFVARPLGLALTGPVAEHVGYTTWLAVIATILATLTLGALGIPSIRRLRLQAPPPVPSRRSPSPDPENHSSCGVCIRTAEPGDAPALVGLLDLLGHPASPEQLRSRLTRLANDPSYTAWIAEDEDGRPVGFAGGHQVHPIEDEEPAAQLIALVTHPDSQGAGTDLLRHFETWAQRLGARRTIIASGHHRSNAHSFYTRRGYVSTGIRLSKSIRTDEAHTDMPR